MQQYETAVEMLHTSARFHTVELIYIGSRQSAVLRLKTYKPNDCTVLLHKYVSIHSVICLTTGPTPLPEWFLHIVQSRASSFKWEYPLLSLKSSSSFLHLLPRFLVTSISLFIFPSITCFRRQFRYKMWPFQLAFHYMYICIYFNTNTLSQ